MEDFMEKYREEQEEKIEKCRKEQKEKRLSLYDKCASKITDSSLIYQMCALRIMQRFELDLRWDNYPPYVCYKILDYYIENVDEDFGEWLYRDDAPLIRPVSDLRKIFPELILYNEIKNQEIIDLANTLYNVGLHLDTNDHRIYIYSYSFDFNSFTPIPIKEIYEIKQEIAILLKYGVDTSALEAKIDSYGLPENVIQRL